MLSLARFDQILLTFLFVVFLFSPVASWLADVQPLPDLLENRRRAASPKELPADSSVAERIKSTEAYVEDRLGLRDTLIQLRNRVLIRFFRQSPNDKVIIGRDDWLFLAANKNLEYYQARELYTEQQLTVWGQRLQANKDTIESLGSKYLIVIAPNKDTIYPEFMPASIPRFSDISRLQQLDRYLEETTDVELLDPSPWLIEQKSEGRLLYRMGGTHWNSLGAFYGYTAIIETARQWFPEIQALELDDFEVETKKSHALGLQILVGMEHLVDYEALEIQRKEPGLATVVETPKIPGLTAQQQPETTEIQGRPLKVVIFHDSFMDDMKPLLIETFGRTAFFHLFYISPTRANVETVREIVERERPDLVIHETVERALQYGVNFPAY